MRNFQSAIIGQPFDVRRVRWQESIRQMQDCRINPNGFGYKYFMREIGQTIDGARLRVQKLVGIKLLIKFDEGRGKESLLEGEIVQAFPAVFTVKLSDGKTRSFSYTDVHTGNVLFLKQKED